MKNKMLFILLMFIYLITPLLILLNKDLYDNKFYILTIVGCFIFIVFKLFKIKNSDLGINKNIISSIKRNIPLMLIFIIIIIVMKILGHSKYNPTETIYFYLFYIFISCPLQEFLYRGVFGYFEKVYNNKYLFLILSSFCYSFVHIIYKDIITCILTFLIGIIWYLLYRKDYNLIGVSISHIILGILTISLGIIN